jgi:hypothetical protein
MTSSATEPSLDQDIGGGKSITELAKKSSPEQPSNSSIDETQPKFEEDFEDVDGDIKNPIWKQATPQLLVVGVIGFVLFGIAGIVLSKIFGGVTNVSTPVTESPIALLSSATPAPSSSQVQAEVALGDQARQMEQFNKRPTAIATPTSTPIPQPKVMQVAPPPPPSASIPATRIPPQTL